MFSVRELNFKYDNNPDYTLKSIDFSAEKGEVILITGPSGSGKSTLLHCLNGLNPSHYGGKLRGSISLDGVELTGKDLWQFSEYTGTVFQNPSTQFFQTNVRHEMAFGLEFRGVESNSINRMIDRASKNHNIEGLMDRDIFSLSSGEKQRVAVASVSLTDQRILLFDEPTANLDLDGVMEFRRTIENLKNQNRIIIIVEHRISYLKGLIDRVVLMKDGTIKMSSSPDILNCSKIRDIFGLRVWDNNALKQKETKKDSEIIFKAEDVVFKKARKEILRGCDISLEKGRVAALTGKNGAGKTTLARAMCGLLKGSKGKVLSEERIYSTKKYHALAGYVSQHADQQLFTDSVYDELMSSSNSSDRVLNLLNNFDLLDKKDSHPHSLSGGEKQRTAIAAGTALEPSVFILDEPTSGMDGYRLNLLADKLNQIASTGTAVLVITHDPELISKCCDRILWMEKGRIENELELSEFIETLEY